MKTSRFLGISLAFVLILTLAGCKSNTSVASAGEVVETVTEDSAEVETKAVIEEETETEEETGPETEEDKMPGIVALVADDTTSELVLTVISIDPDTGRQQTISTFKQTFIVQEEGDNVYYNPYVSTMYTSSGRERLSDDFSKLAYTKQFAGNGELHSGWIDESGIFYDVTVMLGMQAQSDFDDPAHYIAEGFIDDCFVFTNYDDGSCSYVPIDDVSVGAVRDGNPLAESVADTPSGYCLTDWIDSTHCLADRNGYSYIYRTASYIYDTVSGEFTEYIPGSSRTNWNGVLSPDGTTVAFLSTPQSGEERKTPGLYTVSLDGGSPDRIETSLSFYTDATNLCQYPFTQSYTITTTLIDWR